MSSEKRPTLDEARALYEHHAELCKVFSNPIRLMILNALRTQELSVATLAERLNIALGTVSPHLLMMKHRRVLVARKEGNQVFYRLANPKMLKAFDLIRQILHEQMRQHGRLARRLDQERAQMASHGKGR